MVWSSHLRSGAQMYARTPVITGGPHKKEHPLRSGASPECCGALVNKLQQNKTKEEYKKHMKRHIM